jgi:hypothetical protein
VLSFFPLPLSSYFLLLTEHTSPGALRIFLGQRDVILQEPASLCPVMSEDFTGATTECVFGDNGWLAREVDMSWFG